MIIPLSEIEAYYEPVKEYLEIDANHKYKSFSTIKSYYDKYKANAKVSINDYGLDYDDRTFGFIILDRDLINKLVSMYQNIKVTKVTKDTEGKKNNESDKVTKVTKDTEKEEKLDVSEESVTVVTCNRNVSHEKVSFCIDSMNDVLM